MKYKGYLIDLDGTMYRGNERIDAAADFVTHLHQSNIPYLFVTNNSSNTPAFVAEKLNKMNIPATPEHVFTSGMATATYIRKLKQNARCYMIGEEGLRKALKQEGVRLTEANADFVIVGMDRQLTYEKFAKASLAVRNGAMFLSTNADQAVPTERGLLPGNGALTSVITVSTGKQPTFIGKPGHIMMEEALQVLDTPKAETVMIGDNYDTDIQAGIQSGIDTLMVLTGITQDEDIARVEEKPTHCVHSLAEWMEIP